MENLFENIENARSYICRQSDLKPLTGIILGSGLGALANAIDADAIIAYEDIPHFPRSTVKGHGGKLILGYVEKQPVIALSGRFHYYEGYSMQEVTFPVRVMKALGVNTVLLSNAAGGMHPDFRVGDIMLLKDHINLMPGNPLIGINDDRLGPRFPDMSAPYTDSLLKLAIKIANEKDLKLQTGVYAGLPGPCFETRAEYKYLHAIGADAVGMSTVPETIVAVHAGMRVLAASVITDLGIREEENTITHEEVLEAATAAAPKMTLLFKEIVMKLPSMDTV